MSPLRTTIALAIGHLVLVPLCQGQFANTYVHQFSDDHIAVVRANTENHYVQASTIQGATKDIHLMMMDAAGNVVQDVTYFSPAGDEVALDVCRGNNNTYLVCGYEHVGGLDLGFVLQVDAGFNFITKVNIQVPANDRHTPALNIINSAFYSAPPSITSYFPADPTGGYLVTGFESTGYNPNDPKSGYALKLTNALTQQWVTTIDSPNPPGGPDWDMCSHGTFMWTPPTGYFVGGSGTSPAGDQVAMATMLDNSGNVLWTKLYHDVTAPGESSVSVDAAYDDTPNELYQLTNHSSHRGGGFFTFDRNNGNIDLYLSRKFMTNTPDYYVYEFGATCASSLLLISGYGHNQTSGSITGYFPFTFRYVKGNNQPPASPSPPYVEVTDAKYAYPIQSAGYNPVATIFDAYQTGTHPRIYHPKLYAQINTNEITLAAVEDIGSDQENHLLQPQMNGTHSCPYFDPGFVAVPVNITEWPANHQPDSYVITPGTVGQAPLSAQVQVCLDCTVDATFTSTPGAGCMYTFTANAPGSCPLFKVFDIANNMLFSGPVSAFNFTFPTSGTYIICYEDCAFGIGGVVCRDEVCQTIQVNCPPCPLDADFSYTVNGCCVNFSDLTPDGNPDGCEYWVFGTSGTVLAGDVTSYCFPGPGTYTVCHVDCCIDPDGTISYHQVCKQITVNCAPPCCMPTGITLNVSGCCVTANPVLPGVPCTTPMLYVWSMGDGNISFQQNPTHCYAKPGIYTVCLTVICSRSQKVKFCQSIKVGCILPPPPPNGGGGTARFSYNTSGTSISLLPAPSPPDLNITSHLWSFGDGQSSTDETPTHYYPLSGTYDITHVVEGIDLLSGEPFIDEVIIPVTLILAPACGCVPPPTGAFAANSLVCGQSNSVLLKLIDFDTESDIEHQWMVSTCGGPGCATDAFVPIPGAVGQHVWIEDVTSTGWYRCKSTSTLGLVEWSDEVEVTEAWFQTAVEASLNPACPGEPVTLTASGAATYAWSTGESGNIISVAPEAETEYVVDGTNVEGCMSEAALTVGVDVAACGVRVSVKALLEGPLNVSTGLMRDSLRVLGLLPAVEPYTAAGYTWPGGNGGGDQVDVSVFTTTGPDAIADWVIVELRDAVQPGTVLAARCGLLQRDGDIVGPDGVSPLRFQQPPVEYHVAVRHRNHLGIMTADPVALSFTPTTVDLSTDALDAWGTEARKPLGSLRAMWAGNVVADGLLKYTGGDNDRDQILLAIGGTVPSATATGYLSEDVDLDGVVKYTGANNDRDPILQNIGGSVPSNTRAQQLP